MTSYHTPNLPKIVGNLLKVGGNLPKVAGNLPKVAWNLPKVGALGGAPRGPETLVFFLSFFF